MSADNQQERLEINWIVGFTDGEGCFSISIFKNTTSTLGWQVFPEFSITQGAKSLKTLEKIQQFFNCGKIFVNHRHDNHKEDLYRYCVRSVKDLQNIVIPFFEKHRLQTAKQQDFRLFVQAVGLIIQRKHLSSNGLKIIAQIASNMNRKTKSKFLESSETIRQTLVKKSEKI